jgi:hypothetical protein
MDHEANDVSRDLDDPTEPVCDGLLEALNHMTNEGGPQARLGITMTTNGAILTGIMVPRDVWLEQMKTHFGQDDTSPITELWQHFTRDQVPKAPDGGPMDWFIHLIEARYISGHQRLPSEGGMRMRVRLTEIDSWALTTFGTEYLFESEEGGD